MANEKATIEITADATQFTAATKQMQSDLNQVAKTGEEAGNRIGKGLGKGADQAAKEAERASKAIAREIAAIQRETLRLTEGDAAVRAARLKSLGAPQEQIEPLIASYKKATEQSRQFGMSVRATGYAMSLIPAQMTDIVTQLAGGQSPFLILVQQGGQLKDMFGGIGPAINAVGGYLARLVNPLTIAAAAFGALTFAYLKGIGETEKFNKALILTGNSAGVTASQLGSMAANIASSVGNISKASAALVTLVNTGRFSAEQLQSVGESVLKFSEATGTSVEDIGKEFATLIEDPVKGIEKLNDKYNFLTSATYEQIKALVAQRDEQGATTLAIDAFKNATDGMTKEVLDNLGFVELGWKKIKGAVSGATSAVAAFGRQATTEQLQGELVAVNAQIDKLTKNTLRGFNPDLGALNELTRQRGQILAKLNLEEINTYEARERAASQAAENNIISANRETDALLKSARTREQIRKDETDKEEKKYRDGSISYEKYQAAIAAINEKYKDPQGRQFTDDAATRMLQNLREQEAAIISQLGTTEQLTSAEKEHAKFTQLIADLKEKSILTADQQSLQNRQEEIFAQLNLNIAAENQLRIQKEINSVAERGKQIAESIAQAELSRNQQFENQLGAVGQGREAFDRIRQETEIRREFQKFQNQLSKGLSEGTLDTTQFDEQQAKINDGLQVALSNFRKYYEELDSLQANWALGARAGFADYAASARNAAQASSNLIGNAFKGMEDALVTFVKTGKLSFSSLVDSILSDLVRMSTRSAVTGPLADLFKSFLSNIGGAGIGGATTTGTGTTAGGAGAIAYPVRPYADGGYTGDGNKYDVAGIVHRGEYVLNKEATSRLGVGALDRLNRGYANGGFVGGSVAGGMNSGAVNINIKNEAGADGYQATATATKNESGINIDVLVRRSIANDIRNNGPIAQQFGGAFGLRRTA